MRVVLLPTEAMPVAAVELSFDVGQATTPDRPEVVVLLGARAAVTRLGVPDIK